MVEVIDYVIWDRGIGYVRWKKVFRRDINRANIEIWCLAVDRSSEIATPLVFVQ